MAVAAVLAGVRRDPPTIAITAVVLLDGSWLLALFGWYFFTLLSVYLMFFDGAKVAAGHALWVVLTASLFVIDVGPAAGSRTAWTCW